MKTKIFKALSILLALAVVFSACACMIGTVAAADEQPSYNVGGPNDTLTTIEAAIQQAIDDGHNSADKTVTLNLASGAQVFWANDSETVPAHDFKLVITSEQNTTVLKSANGKGITLGGNTEMDGVTIKTAAGFKINGFDFRNGPNTVVHSNDLAGLIVLGGNEDSVITTTQNIEVNQLWNGKAIVFSNFDKTATFDADINVTYDAEEVAWKLQTFMVGSYTGKETIFNKNVNFNIKSGDVQFNHSVLRTFGSDAALQIINSSGKEIPTLDGFSDITNAYFINNESGEKDLLGFTETAGKYTVNIMYATDKVIVKDSQDQIVKELVYGDTELTLEAAGTYKVSIDRPEPEPDENAKMLYYRVSGGGHRIISAADIVPGGKYVFEYNIYCTLDESEPAVYNGDTSFTKTFNENGDKALESFEATKIDDYYKVVCKVTIPEDYTQKPDGVNEVPGYRAHFGVWLPPFSEGYIFNRVLYQDGDPMKTNLLPNAGLQDGLDHVKIDDNNAGGAWFATWDPSGLYEWVGADSSRELKVLDFDEEVIKAFAALGKFEDTTWWEEKDIVEEVVPVTYATANGTFKDSTGKAIKDAKMLLISDENQYNATTNANGEFSFGKIVTGFYELYVLNGSEKIFTGFSQYIAQDDVVTFDVVSDITNLVAEYEAMKDSEVVEEAEEVEEIAPSGNLSGTVYTPYLETVANLKLYLEGIGEITTDENGNFAFADVPVGKYKLYTVLEDETKYEFREVEIQDNVDLKVKLKFDPPKESFADTEEVNNGWIVWVIVASVVALVVVAGLIFFLVIKKKRV